MTLSSIPNRFYTCAQVSDLDRRAIEEGIPGIQLMKRAGRDAFELALTRWPATRSWLVLCGAGNNGGDGYVIAALAAQRKHHVTVLYLTDPGKLKGDARRAYEFAQQEGVTMAPFTTSAADTALESQPLLIDALLGSGVKGDVREPFLGAIRWMNVSGAPVLSVDLPSGLSGDTGAILGESVRASATVTFIGCKAGLVTGHGPGCTGELFFSDLDVPAGLFEPVTPVCRAPDRRQLKARLPERRADAHKGQFGHVMVIGGGHGYGGAALLASETAVVTGVGLTSLATLPEHVSAALIRRPEVIAIGVVSGQELEPHLQRPSALVVGPGLGQTPWSEQMLQQALASGLPAILDADALNILAQGRQALPQDETSRVITPHPGEAARLLECSTQAVQADRFAAVRALHQRTGAVVVLKGAGTLVHDGRETVLAPVGNAGLARGGTGDVLSGLIGGLMAQGLSGFEAAQLAVCMHGDAANQAVEHTGVHGLLAAELIPHIRRLLAP